MHLKQTQEVCGLFHSKVLSQQPELCIQSLSWQYLERRAERGVVYTDLELQ